MTGPAPAAAPVRVLLVSGSFPPMRCGVGDYTRALAGALAARDDLRVGVLTSGAAGPGPAGRYEVLAAMDRWACAEAGRAREAVRRFRPDLVHFQFPSQGYRGNLSWLLPALVRLSGVPVVQTWHETVPARWGGWAQAAPTPAEKLRTVAPQVALALVPGPVVVVRPEFEARMPSWYRALPLGGRLAVVPNASVIPRVELGEGERRALRERYAPGKALLAFFGFFTEQKGIDDVLAIMDPARDHLVLVGAANEEDPYQRALLARVRSAPLAGRVTLTGFLAPDEVARILAAADAVVLPYRSGGGSWNTTLKAAVQQGTFVLTTSEAEHGYDEGSNVYFARPGDPADLARGLAAHLGRRHPGPPPAMAGPGWPEIAEAHARIYRGALAARRAGPSGP